MPVKIFCCYAREDESLLNKLKSHLRSLQHIGRIEVWHDRDINAGAQWEEEINKNLNEAQIILLLVSPDFMNSDYCYGKEMKKALERHERGEAVTIPIILRRVHWKDILGDIRALPRDGEPVMSSMWHSLDDAFFDVTEGIRQAIRNLKTPPQRNPTMPKQTLDVQEQLINVVVDEKKVASAIIPKIETHQGEVRESYQSGVLETSFDRFWKSLRNPYGLPEIGEMITSHVSGRKADIDAIITEGQNAIILAGAPHIGKTSLIRYLQRPPNTEWSWRDELADLDSYFDLNKIHFIQIDLSLLEGIPDTDALLVPFIAQCTAALQSVSRYETAEYNGLKGLRHLLRQMTRENPEALYFFMLDNIERLQGLDMPLLKKTSKAQTSQEFGMALLDEFPHFGGILSIESLPLPKIGDQFRHVSADLNRFLTMTLQAFTQEDTLRFLAQDAESFGEEWARRFREARGDVLFSQDMQTWLYEQAGTHPYLLQQICFHAFHFKREYALRRGSWSDLQNTGREQLLERVNERSSTFLDRTWKRVRASLDISSQETRENFHEFITRSKGKSAAEEIDPAIWNRLGSELRYILYSEGIVRYDPFQPIYYPGAVLLNYLAQKAQEQAKLATSEMLSQSQATMSNTNELFITLPGEQPVDVELSLLEYSLIKTLLQHPQRCTEEELMKAAWGKIVSKQVLTQRLFHLRKKLKDLCGGEDMIENRYGGLYLLNHAEWLRIK